MIKESSDYHHKSDVKKALAVAQSALHSEPSGSENRNKLAGMMLQIGEFNSSFSLLSGSPTLNNLHTLPTTMTLRAIALAISGNDYTIDIARREAQRAIMLSPSDANLWITLTYVMSRLKVSRSSGVE
jgi:Flp pilus assembly protein TadD